MYFPVLYTTYFLFYKGALEARVNRNSPEAIAYLSLIRNFSFKPYSNSNSFLFVLSQIKEAVSLIWTKRDTIKRDAITSNGIKTGVIYSSHKYSVDISENYIYQLEGNRPSVLVENDNYCLPSGTLLKLMATIWVLANSIIVFILSLSGTNFKRRFSVVTNLSAVFVLSARLKEEKIEKLYNFSAYETYSNLLYLVLKNMDVQLVKICSPNPISVHYQYVLSDKFVFTCPYQLEEYKQLKENWKIGEYALWPIYEFYKLKQVYYHLNKDVNTKNIGFLSNGQMARKLMGKFVPDTELANAEIRLLTQLAEFVKQDPSYNVVIYFHPIEKNPEVFDTCKTFYTDFFKHSPHRLVFADTNNATWQGFSDYNVSVSVYSTVNLERLYCGFKVLYYACGIKQRYFNGNVLENVMVFKEEEFNLKLSQTLQLNATDYFQTHHLNDYTYYGIKKDNR